MQTAFTFSKTMDEAPLPFADYAFPANMREWNGLVLVGEAPGAEEARQGRPFVGRSGQLLDKILAEAGIDRSRTMVANVFRHQPPANKIDTFFASKKAAKTMGIALAEEYGKFGSFFCRKDFASEIDHLRNVLTDNQPNIIVALGRTPLWALTGENGLLNKVGQPLRCRLAPQINVIPTYHPSFILRGNWGLQETWLTHFKTAVKQLK